MRDFGMRLRPTSTAIAMIAVTSCGGSQVLLQSLDGGAAGTSDAAHVDAPDAGPSEDGGADATGASVDAGADGDAGVVVGRVCGDLPVRDLSTVADVKAALSLAGVYPGAWGPCATTILACPSGSPDIAFDQDLTTMSCGGDSESGFHPHVSYPMTVVDTGVKASFELRVETDAGVKSYVLVAQGQLGGARGFKLLEPDVTKTQWVSFEPLLPLP